MIRIGLISNPRSQRNRRDMPPLRELVRRHGDLLHVELDRIDATAEALQDFARREVALVAVSGGDGTVQKVITELLNGGALGAVPRLAILPGGMTNLIAADVGMRGRPLQALARLCAMGPAPGGETLVRPVISLQRVPGEAPIHGMFMGTAAFYHGIMLAREKVHPLGAERHLAAAMGLGLSLLRLVTGRGGAGGLLRGERIAIGLGDAPPQAGDYLLLMATTLRRLILGLMPFWEGGEGALRFTTIGYPPRRLGRALLPVLRGRPRPWMLANGYSSTRAHECRLTLDCPIVFDGEFVRPDPAIPVVLRGDRQIAFWRC
jgi:diacylglycerol kinase (ATP)